MSKDDEDFIMDEFEWALKDPTEEKLRALGEVVSIITTKLTEAVSKVMEDVYELQTQLSKLESSFDAKISSLQRTGVAAASPSPAAAVAGGEPMAMAPIAKAPPPKAPSGPGGMMGELKALLAARRRKTEGSQ
ncbi:MAG: hypothetical protein ACXAEE_02180 [Candidatus Thorarchaeota archaeon]|jgi:hypothetical protein